MIKIEVSRRDVAWLLRPLQEFPKECQGAMWQAVKRSLSTARKEMTEEISALAYLKRSVIRDAVQPVQMYGKKRAEHDRRYKVADKDKVFGVIRVSGRKTPLDAYRLAPNAPTRPKGSTGNEWPLAGYQLGPRYPVRYKPKTSDRSKGFVLRGKSGKLRFMQEKLGRRHQYQGRSVPTLIWTHDYTVQYFAVFDEVVDPIGRNVKRRFISVLQHEIDFRIAKLAAKGK